jgi:hypothetical protein
VPRLSSLVVIPSLVAAWSIAAICGLLYIWHGISSAPYLIVALMLLIAAVGMARGSRWAWRLALGIALVVAVAYVQFFVINTAALLRGSELYTDSPATYFVVLITCAFTLFPAASLLFLFWLYRVRIWPLIALPRQAKAA